ncbi:MAG: Lrp/AsnC family transcriptional regulator, partial [Nanoarchaeota archaeon]|nr:Lrp/AsnC family transcriptional regulator [Nanoarchaeota archaeon]MBU1597404.1 Lrp/AsnC family transcriptional regulator [Nanoarchaeota archaeon]
KILNQLDLNCRQSDSGIGKKVRLSKQVVNYRIKRLLNNKIIISFFPHINVSKLGYATHKIYIQLRSVTKDKEKEIWDFLVSQSNILWVISCSGKWDLIFGTGSNDIEDFDSILTDFMNKFSDNVLNRQITVFNKATIHHRKWILNDEKDVSWLIGGKVENNQIDKLDKNILILLNKNARMPVIEIAEKLGESSSRVIYRIKQLQNKGIIGAYRTSINKKKLGINYCKSFIYYQNKTTKKENQLLTYCYQLPCILGVSQSIGAWDLELEFEVKNYDEFHHIMKEMKNKFPLIRSFDTVYIEKEYGESFLPDEM